MEYRIRHVFYIPMRSERAAGWASLLLVHAGYGGHALLAIPRYGSVTEERLLALHGHNYASLNLDVFNNGGIKVFDIDYLFGIFELV